MTGTPVENPDARASLARRLLRNPLGLVSSVVLAAAVLSAVFAPVLAPYPKHNGDISQALLGPGSKHLLGTDVTGSDMLTDLLFAGQYSLAGAALTLGIASALGITAGLLAGYFRGWFDTVADWIVSLVMALPGMIVLLAARAVVGPGMWSAMAIVGVLIAPAFYRVVRSSVIGVRGELYVDAARVAGLSDLRIIRRHVLKVVRAPIIIQTAMVAGAAVGLQAGLEFVGLGDPNSVTWGTLLNQGFANIYTAPLLLVWPCLVVGLFCVACVLLANALRDTLESGGGSVAAATEPVDSADSERQTVVHPVGDLRAVSEELLAVTGLRVGYDQPGGGVVEVVCGVDLRLRRGEVHGLVGESGSGKTQTAFAILGVLSERGRILAGSVLFKGDDLVGASEKTLAGLRGRHVAYIPQEPMANLDPSFTIGAQLAEPMRFHLGLSRAEARDRALDLLARVGIADPRQTFAAYPHQVSGGMAQRVLIAGAISCDPDLLIADEPTTALDVTIQAEVLDLLRDLQSERQMGVLLVTHNFGVVADLCDSVSVMRDGRVVETGPVRAVFQNPTHPYTRSLLDAIIDDGPVRRPLDEPTLTEVTE